MEILNDIRLFEDSDLPTLQLLHYKDGDFFIVFRELEFPDDFYYKVSRCNQFTESEVYSTIPVAFISAEEQQKGFITKYVNSINDFFDIDINVGWSRKES